MSVLTAVCTASASQMAGNIFENLTAFHSSQFFFKNKFGSSQPPTVSQHGTGTTSRIFGGVEVLLGSLFSPKQRHICCLSYKNKNTK